MCLELLNNYDTAGCNLSTSDVATHYSGNFWWATSNYIKGLNFLQDDDSAELWLLSNKSVKSYEIHSSNINHHHSEYPFEKYMFE